MYRKVVVTGAHGFIGRHVCRHLANSGYSVIGIGHGKWDPKEAKSWGLAKWCESEITVENLLKAFDSPYAIFHFAGGSSVPYSLANPLKDFERSVVTTGSVLEFVRLHSPTTRIVYPSSASVYGTVDKSPISESVSPAPISPYGVHKWLAEQMLALHARQYGISVAIVRLFSVYGRGLRKQLLWDACRKLASGESAFMGTGNELRDWLHVSDASQLLLVAMDKACEKCPVVNAGTGAGVSVRDIVNRIAQCLRPPAAVPQFTGTQRAGDPTSFVADTSRAEDWGWKPSRQWLDGVAEYVAWWQDERDERDEKSIAVRHALDAEPAAVTKIEPLTAALSSSGEIYP
jgi:UDP-glucose 4-epimerase